MESANIIVSIIIPVYNRSSDLHRCLQSIVDINCEYLEVIVIDDCSTDSTVAMVSNNFPSVNLIVNKFNYGPSYARNIGINASRGEYILFLDSDTVIQKKDLFEKFIKFFSEHDDAGTVGGEIRVYENCFDKVYGRTIKFNGDSSSIAINHSVNNYVKCDYLATCCCMVKKDVALKVGGFDPYYIFGSEDKDFGFRITRNGLCNYLVADCGVEHYHCPRGRKDNETYMYHMAMKRFVLKCYPLSRSMLVIMMSLFYILLFYMIIPIKISYLGIRNRNICRENITGGMLIFKSIINNFIDYNKIIESRGMDFLSPHNINQYSIEGYSDSNK